MQKSDRAVSYESANCADYIMAFDLMGDRQGMIRISARAYGKGDIEFLFSDNGIGLPDGFDPHKTDTLGMQLIHSLAESQLCGRLEVRSSKGGGTAFGIWFNDGRENLAT